MVLYISNLDEIKYNIVRILHIEMNTLIDEYMYQYKHIENPLFYSLFRLYFQYDLYRLTNIVFKVRWE